jgi:uncharacterized membrane protein (UPF0127 family)
MSATEQMPNGVIALVGADGQVVCERCRVPETRRGRMRGLLGRSDLPRGEGMLLRGVSSIHTFFMRFVIDAVFLDRDLVVVGVNSEVPPWRVVAKRSAWAVLELSGGEGARRGIRPGERLSLVPVPVRKEELR